MPEKGIKLFPHNEILSYEEILEIVKIFTSLGIKRIRITGGEPLIRRNLPYLIEKINEFQEIKDIAITTNGILLKDMAKELLKAGLKRVNISLDTLHPDKYEKITKQKGLKNVLDAIHECLSIGISPVKINNVLIKGVNDDEIIDFVRLTEKLPIHVRFIEYMPWGNTEYWDISKVFSTQDLIGLIEKEMGTLSPIKNDSGGPAKSFQIKNFAGVIGFINPVSSHFCNLCNRIRLTADGKIRLCLFSETEIDLKSYLRKNTDRKTLVNVVKDAIYRKPQNHNLSDHINKHQREMNQIGG